MTRLASVVCVLVLWPALALAQSSDPNSSSLAPQDRVGGGNVQANAPGVTVRSAIARHTQLMTDRLTSARLGIESSDSTSGGSTSGSGTSGSTGGLSSLLNLVNQFGGGGATGLSSLSDLSGLISGLTSLGGTSTTGGTTTTGGSSTGGSTSDGGIDPRLQMLLDLRDANIGSSDGSSSGTLKSNQKSRAAQSGGAVNKLWKPESAAQSTDGTTTEDRSFKDRLLESWATAGFTALSVGFQTPQFITLLEDGLTLIFRPKASPELVAIVQGLQDLVDALLNASSGTGDTGDNTGDDTGNDTGDDTGGDTGGGNDPNTVL